MYISYSKSNLVNTMSEPWPTIPLLSTSKTYIVSQLFIGHQNSSKPPRQQDEAGNFLQHHYVSNLIRCMATVLPPKPVSPGHRASRVSKMLGLFCRHPHRNGKITCSPNHCDPNHSEYSPPTMGILVFSSFSFRNSYTVNVTACPGATRITLGVMPL